jgi:hypothetical protein
VAYQRKSRHWAGAFMNEKSVTSLLLEQLPEDHLRIVQNQITSKPTVFKPGMSKHEGDHRLIQDFFCNQLNHIKAYTDEHGVKSLFSVSSDNIAKVENRETIINNISPKLKMHGFNLLNKKVKEHYDTWLAESCESAPMPPSFSLDPIEVTFNRINISVEDGPTPTWDYFISKCGLNGKALMAFTWSLLDKNDKSQQFAFLKGPGKDGKGSYTRWLNKLFNDQTVGLTANNKLWLSQCVGKRVGIFSDINNTSITMTSEFKQVTGGDKVTIEQKYEKAYSIFLDSKFVLTTNRKISIIDDVAMKRRAILIELEKADQTIDGYENILWAETPYFLFKCKQAYLELYEKSINKIECDYTFFDETASDFEEHHEVLFDRCFVLDSNNYVTAGAFQATIQHELNTKDNHKVSAFKDWLERTHGIKRKPIRSDCNRIKVYPGIRLKSC